MWWSTQLPSVSRADSKLDLTTVRRSLQSAPGLPALDPLPVSKNVCQTCCNFVRFLTPSDLDVYKTFSTEIWHSTYSCPGERLYQFWFLHFCFPSYDPVLDRWTDGQTDGQARCVMWHIGWLHNKQWITVNLMFKANKMFVNLYTLWWYIRWLSNYWCLVQC